MHTPQHEENAINALITMADRVEKHSVSLNDFRKCTGHYIPDAEFITMNFYEENLPSSLQDLFTLACVIHINNPFPCSDETTHYTATILPSVDLKHIGKKKGQALAQALKYALTPANNQKIHPPQSPVETLNFITKLDDLLTRFP